MPALVGMRRLSLSAHVPGFVSERWGGFTPFIDGHIDFTRNLYWVRGVGVLTWAQMFSLSGAGSEWAFDADGNLQAYATTVPARRDGVGWQIPEGATCVTRNSSLAGAVAGSPGTLPTNMSFTIASGLSRSVVATGTEYGMPYVDVRISGTPSSTAEAISCNMGDNLSAALAPASNGQSWSAGVYVRRVSGSNANLATGGGKVQIHGRNTGGSSVSSSESAGIVLSEAMQRYKHTHTMAHADVAYANAKFTYNAINTTDAIDFTIRLYCPMQTQTSFLGPPILTTGSALARGARIPSMIGAAAASIIRAVDVFSETEGVLGGSSPSVLAFGGASNARMGFANSLSVFSQNGVDAATGNATIGGGLTYANRIKAAFGLGASLTKVANGGTPGVQAVAWGDRSADTPYVGNTSAGTRALNGDFRVLAWTNRVFGLFAGATA